MEYDLEYMEEIIKARTLKDCFLIDLPEPRPRFGLRLILNALTDHKFGGYVGFRIYQRSMWIQLKLQNQTGIMRLIKIVPFLIRRHLSNIIERFVSIIFLTRISAFAEIYPGMDATFDNLGITAGARVYSGVVIAANVTLVSNRGLAPTIREGTKLLTGSVIIGRVSVGPNAVVTPNSVVFRDVPESATVTGNPAVVVSPAPVFD